MFSTSTVNVIHSEKFNLSFSTTHTLSPVVLNYVKAGVFVIFFYALVGKLFMSSIILFRPFVLFVYGEIVPLFSVGKAFFSVGLIIFLTLYFCVISFTRFTPHMKTIFCSFRALKVFRCCGEFPLTFGTAFRYNVHIRTSNIGFGQTPDCFRNAGELCNLIIS